MGIQVSSTSFTRDTEHLQQANKQPNQKAERNKTFLSVLLAGDWRHLFVFINRHELVHVNVYSQIRRLLRGLSATADKSYYITYCKSIYNQSIHKLDICC